MDERPAPRVATRGPVGGRDADVIGSGSDEERPGRRRGTVLAAGLTALVLGGLAVAQQDDGSPPTTPEPDLALIASGGGLTAQWGNGGQLDVSLPLLIRNDGGPMTIASVALDGTALTQPAVDVAVVPGGRLPVTLRQTMSCPGGASVPADAALRLGIVRDGRQETRVMPLPEGAASSLASALRAQCAAVPLEQAVVVRGEQEEVLPTAVIVRVHADNIGPTGVQLLSVEPATGLAVTVVPDAPGAPAALPVVLGREGLSLRLAVAVGDCDVAASRDLSGTFAVADVVYDDGRGNGAVKAVSGEFPGLRDVVQSTC